MYELKYDLKTVKLIEQSTGKTMVDLIQGVPQIQELEILVGFALYDDVGNKVTTKRGVELAEELVMANGILPLYTTVSERVVEDCGFLFLGV